MPEPALIELMRRPEARPLVPGAALTLASLKEAIPGTPAAPGPATSAPRTPAVQELSLAEALAELPDLFLTALRSGRLAVPVGARPYAVRGSYTDAATASGNTTHALVAATVPKGVRFVVRKRLAILDTTAGAVRGGITLLRNGVIVYDGAGAMDGVTATEPGEFLGGTGLDSEWDFEFDAGDKIELTAKLIRGGTAVSVAVHGSLTGYLVPSI